MVHLCAVRDAVKTNPLCYYELFEINRTHDPRLQALPFEQAWSQFQNLMQQRNAAKQLLTRYEPLFCANNNPEEVLRVRKRSMLSSSLSSGLAAMLFGLAGTYCEPARDYFNLAAISSGSVGGLGVFLSMLIYR